MAQRVEPELIQIDVTIAERGGSYGSIIDTVCRHFDSDEFRQADFVNSQVRSNVVRTGQEVVGELDDQHTTATERHGTLAWNRLTDTTVIWSSDGVAWNLQARDRYWTASGPWVVQVRWSDIAEA